MKFNALCSIAVLFTLAASTGCGTGVPDTAARGAVSAAWSLTVAAQPATCAHVGATSVALRLHPRASGEDLTFSFACTATQGTTPLVTARAYDVTLTLQAADGATLATAPTQAGVTIAAGQVTALAPAVFAVSDRGKLVLSFAALATRTNCATPDQRGAGINGTTIALTRAAGGCAPVTFVRTRGTTTLGEYTVVCGSPPVASCIERDETLSVDGIESGPYVIHVGGLIGALRCWEGDDVLSVPAAGVPLVKTVELASQHATGC